MTPLPSATSPPSEPDPLPPARSAAQPTFEGGEAPPTPVLEARDVRIAVGGAVALDAFSLCTRGARVLLAGDSGALMGTLCGTGRVGVAIGSSAPHATTDARVVAGTLRVAGGDVSVRAHHGKAGLAPIDPPLPTRWTVEHYLRWAARLGGTPRRAAREVVRGVLARLGLEGGSGRRIGTLAVPERRAVVLAQALVADPIVLVAEQPLSGLEGPAAAWLAEVLVRATADRATVLSVARINPAAWEGGLSGHATDLCYFAQGRMVLNAAPADVLGELHWVDVCVAGPSDELAGELARDGIELRGGPQRFVALVPPGGARGQPSTAASRILAAASRARAPVIRCVPIF